MKENDSNFKQVLVKAIDDIDEKIDEGGIKWWIKKATTVIKKFDEIEHR